MSGEDCNLVKMKLLMLFLLTKLLASSPLVFSQSKNLCSVSGLCCMHRSSKCVVQVVHQDHHLDRALPCYCDHSCTFYRDCCQDYRQFCRGGSTIGKTPT